MAAAEVVVIDAQSQVILLATVSSLTHVVVQVEVIREINKVEMITVTTEQRMIHGNLCFYNLYKLPIRIICKDLLKMSISLSPPFACCLFIFIILLL